VLIVDDDAGVRDVCTTLLHALGYAASEASSGDKAIESLSLERPLSLVLLDLELPGMRGEDVLRALKAKRPQVPVLVMSGKVGRDLSTVLAHGADGVLRKPFKMSDLDRSLGAAIRN
jgi:two-component system KDP operon response regulator KdpE